MKQFTQQEIENALKRTPKTIQEEMSNPVATAESLVGVQKKFELHMDQLGVMTALTRNMLLGLVNPQEFLQGLIEVKVPDAQARQIMQDVNEQIFMPLREQMKKEGSVPAQAAPPAPVQRVVAPPAPRVTPPQAPVPSYAPPIYSAPPLQSPRYVRAEQEDSTAVYKVAPLPPKMTMPGSPAPVATPKPAVAPKPASVTAVVEHLEALPVGEEVNSKQEQEAVEPTQAISTQSSSPAPAPVIPPAAEPTLRLAEPETPTPPKAFVTPPVPVRAPNADDPYREPIEQ